MKKLFKYAIGLIKAIKILPETVIMQNDFLTSNGNKNDIKSDRILMGKILSEMNSNKIIQKLSDVEFSVFSQWGDDGIIQYIIQHTDIPYKTFIEFGVENYKESNTRFLLINNNWSGFVIDGSKNNIDYIKKDFVSWGYELVSKEAFITTENINLLIEDFLQKGYNREIGILSIDIDGNDYWVWKAITVINPIVVIIEYNSLFGPSHPYTIPYDPKFQRYHADHRLQYYGTSLSAAFHLANEKGYSFIGCNNNGNNAYFIRSDKNQFFKSISAEEGYVKSRFREFFINGERASGDERLTAIEGKPVINVLTGKTEILKIN